MIGHFRHLSCTWCSPSGFSMSSRTHHTRAPSLRAALSHIFRAPTQSLHRPTSGSSGLPRCPASSASVHASLATGLWFVGTSFSCRPSNLGKIWWCIDQKWWNYLISTSFICAEYWLLILPRKSMSPSFSDWCNLAKINMNSYNTLGKPYLSRRPSCCFSWNPCRPHLWMVTSRSPRLSLAHRYHGCHQTTSHLPWWVRPCSSSLFWLSSSFSSSERKRRRFPRR